MIYILICWALASAGCLVGFWAGGLFGMNKENRHLTDLYRRITSHQCGEAVVCICEVCREKYWVVDDETIECPRCKEK